MTMTRSPPAIWVTSRASTRCTVPATGAVMEASIFMASITAPVGGTVSRVALADTAHVSGGDLVLVIDPQ